MHNFISRLSFTRQFLLGTCVLRDHLMHSHMLYNLGWVQLNEVGVNCKKGASTDIKMRMPHL